jgi:hypothetical protein
MGNGREWGFKGAMVHRGSQQRGHALGHQSASSGRDDRRFSPIFQRNRRSRCQSTRLLVRLGAPTGATALATLEERFALFGKCALRFSGVFGLGQCHGGRLLEAVAIAEAKIFGDRKRALGSTHRKRTFLGDLVRDLQRGSHQLASWHTRRHHTHSIQVSPTQRPGGVDRRDPAGLGRRGHRAPTR